jgi:hypothetical protein
MSRQLNTVNTAADTFDNWVTKTNDIVLLVNTDVVTVQQNSAGDFTTGNGYIIGIFGSNTLVATNIRGGNVVNSATLNMTSNTNFTSSQVNSTANIYFENANVFIKTTSATTFEGNVYAYANSSQQIFSIVSNNSTYSISANVANGFFINGNTSLYGALSTNLAATFSNTVSVTGATVLSNTLNVVGAINVQSTANVAGTLGVVGAAAFNGGMVVNGAATYANTIAVTGNAIFSNTINVTGNATFVNVFASYANITSIQANSLTVAGNLTVNSTGAFGVYYSNNITSSTNGYFANSTVIAIGNTSVNTQITPSSVTSNNGIFTNLNVSGAIVGTFSPTSNFIPTPNNNLLLGSSGNVFSQIYATNVYTNSISGFSGNINITTDINLTGSLSINSNNIITSGRYTFISSAANTIDSYPIATYRSGEYMLQMSETNTTNFHVTKVIVYHDDTVAYSSEFAQMFNNISLGVVTSDISGGNVRLVVTPVSANVVVKYTKNLITI